MKTYFTCLLVSILLVAINTQLAIAKQREAMTVDEIKSKIAKMGVGEKAKATVFLKDGKKIKGYISQAGDIEFVLRDRKTDVPTTIGYNDVARVDRNQGHSTARNLAIGIGIGAGAFLAILAIAFAHLD